MTKQEILNEVRKLKPFYYAPNVFDKNKIDEVWIAEKCDECESAYFGFDLAIEKVIELLEQEL